MTKRIWMFGALLSALALAPEASAQEQFGSQGRVVIGAERLMGVVSTSQESTVEGTPPAPDVEVNTQYTTITLLANPLGGTSTTYSFPRIGFDFFVADGFTIGAALGYFTLSGSVEIDGDEQDIDGGNGFLLAPRLGYGVMFTDSVGLWPRAGITYVGSSSENTDADIETSTNRLALSLEVPLLLSPARHAAITLAPTLDLGLSGSTEVTNTATDMRQEADVTATEFGAQVGLLLWF